jgi:shikimate dehydrogenase
VSSPTAATRLYAVLGDPVSHSLSPAFQNAAIRAAGLDAVYLALHCPAADLPGLLRGIAHAGGGGNVTVPHKAAAAAAVDRRTATVERTGACNTFWLQDGEVWGDNTDVEGARRAIEGLAEHAGITPRRVLLLGSGGAASAVLAALEALPVEEVGIVGRSPDRVRALRERFPELPARAGAEPEGGDWDLVVNATPLGLREGERPPVGGARFRAALDLVYAPGGTPWVRALRAEGRPAADGTEMLLHQGAGAFRRWFGREPDVEVMRAVLRAAAG